MCLVGHHADFDAELPKKSGLGIPYVPPLRIFVKIKAVCMIRKLNE